MDPVILLVDDDIDTTILLSYYLNKIGRPLQIYKAKNPVEALDLFHKYKNDITHIICDHYMPIENGLELCKIIKQQKNSVKIILYSKDSNLKNDKKLLYVDNFLIKPHGINQINELITQSSC